MLHTFFSIMHLFGVAIGAGGAYMSDVIFFYSIRNAYLSKMEIKFMTLGSRMVWIGLGILFLSGLGLFLNDPEKYLASSKFLTKMTIVLIIFVNGLFFHFFHFEKINKHVGRKLKSAKAFFEENTLLLVSGVVSFLSWTFAIILGGLRSISYSYGEAMSFYLAILLIAILTTLFVIHSSSLIGKKR